MSSVESQLSFEQQLRAWTEYLRDLGLYDFYRQGQSEVVLPQAVRIAFAARAVKVQTTAMSAAQTAQSAGPGAASRPPAPSLHRALPASRPAEPLPREGASKPQPFASPQTPTPYFNTEATPGDNGSALPAEFAAAMPKPKSFDELVPLSPTVLPPEQRGAALKDLRAEIGDCTRCPLAYAGRHTIVFGDGDPNARLMFVGEGPGADEDASGVPFVGKAGQLLNNMITAMGLAREQVYIANIVKCRPPGNRTPEFVEATTCSQFLIRQIDIVRPEVIVALGTTAATYLLGVRQSLASLRGQWHTARGAKVAVTYHPAFLLRDPRQKGEAWKDLQRVMSELKLTPPRRPA